MKSGYGVELNNKVKIVTRIKDSRDNTVITEIYDAPKNSSFVCVSQSAFAYFPEFKFAKYNRMLEWNEPQRKFTFSSNKYSTFSDNVHFTPIWYPDTVTDKSLAYKVFVKNDFAYTPAGKMTFVITTMKIVLANDNL